MALRLGASLKRAALGRGGFPRGGRVCGRQDGLAPWRASAGGWSASVVVILEAGEELRRLAADIQLM
ncbi:DUF6228 family protein [Amycolatopsis thermoflava]|uniref:DUF6228 family protein n=1 Tax=Amycolatopsis thermoflava TaxID=84480 RepID=UPI003655D602